MGKVRTFRNLFKHHLFINSMAEEEKPQEKAEESPEKAEKELEKKAEDLEKEA